MIHLAQSISNTTERHSDMKYPPSAEEVEARHKDSYRSQINRIEVRCLGISHMLDKYTVLREPHRTPGLNFENNSLYRYGKPYIRLTCDECFSDQREAFELYLEEHPLESYSEPKKGVRLFYYKGKHVGEHHLSNFSLRNNTTFRVTYPNHYQELRVNPRKGRDVYGRPLPRRKPTPILSFTTTEEFYAYLESETHQS